MKSPNTAWTEPPSFRLMIVDDDEAVRSGLKRIFHSFKECRPAMIVEADSGAAALALLREHPVDCVLLDYQMPGVDGLAVLSDLKETLPDLAVIMLTGCGNEQVAVEAMKQGAMDYLVKGDIQPRDLMATLMNVLEKQQMKRTIQRQQQQLLEAERQRVMIESLGAACHHLGQPVTVLSAFLTLIQREVSDEKISTELLACEQAVEQIRVLLERFQTLRTYRTEPYLPGSQTDGSASEGSRILQI